MVGGYWWGVTAINGWSGGITVVFDRRVLYCSYFVLAQHLIISYPLYNRSFSFAIFFVYSSFCGRTYSTLKINAGNLLSSVLYLIPIKKSPVHLVYRHCIMFVRVFRDLCRRTGFSDGQNIVRRCLHVTRSLDKNRDRRSFLSSVPRKDEGTEGEKFVYIDSAITKWVLFLLDNLFRKRWIFRNFYASTPFLLVSCRLVWLMKTQFIIRNCVTCIKTNREVLFFRGKKICFPIWTRRIWFLVELNFQTYPFVT